MLSGIPPPRMATFAHPTTLARLLVGIPRTANQNATTIRTFGIITPPNLISIPSTVRNPSAR